MSTGTFQSIVDRILQHARRKPDHPALVFDNGDGPIASYAYGALADAIRNVAANLSARDLAGQRLALLFGAGSDFVLAALGTIAAGGVAVPLAPMGRRRERVRNLLPIIRDCAPGALVIDSAMAAQYGEELAAAMNEEGIAYLPFEDLLADRAGTLPPLEAGALAVLQYTSGSTSLPKGVMISHGNLMANQAMIQAAFGHDEHSDFVGWAPHFHDQGLFGNILQPLYLGSTCVLAAPAAFIGRPLVWLELIDRYRAHTSGGPNFAFDLCTEQAARRGLPNVDLSCWKVAFNGAEPIRAESLAAFARCFAAVGFREESLLPCYGLAECTLVSVAMPPADPPIVRQIGANALPAVCCGPAMAGSEVRIVDTETREALPKGSVGEVWLAGPHVASGYWQRPDPAFGNHLADGSGPWLCTGDLGLEDDNGFYIVGRIKDLLIVRGRNYAPNDVEQLWTEVMGHAGQAASAAFQIDRDNRTHVVLVAEGERGMRRSDALRDEVEALAAKLRSAGMDRLDLSVADLVLVSPGGVPRTTSGKVRRAATRQALLDGSLPILAAAGPLRLHPAD